MKKKIRRHCSAFGISGGWAAKELCVKRIAHPHCAPNAGALEHISGYTTAMTDPEISHPSLANLAFKRCPSSLICYAFSRAQTPVDKGTAKPYAPR